MKKRILTMILSALLLTNATACNVTENGTTGTSENTTTTPTEATTTTTATELENPPSNSNSMENSSSKVTMACNGNYYNSNVTYTINQNNELIIHIESWNESFVIPNQDMYFVSETVQASSVVLGNDQGAVIFGDFSVPTKPIKVIRFEKGKPQVTVENLSYETNQTYQYKYCNFTDEKTGYLFLFGATDRIELSKLLKTTDSGQTWIEQSLENAPSLDWKAWIICAKMLDESIGFISGRHWADDNFSKRTYVTTDGGGTWTQVVLPTNGPYVVGPDSGETETVMAGIEAYDLLYKDGQYILCLKQRQDDSFIYFKYSSVDLVTWTYVEQ